MQGMAIDSSLARSSKDTQTDTANFALVIYIRDTGDKCTQWQTVVHVILYKTNVV